MFFNFCGERMVMEYLSCQLEKHDADFLVYLSIYHNGERIMFGCFECTKKYGYWCEEHHCQHSGFPPDGTACIKCIAKLAALNAANATSYLKKLEEGLPNAIWQELCDFLDPQPEAPDVKFRAMRVIHELATRAVCKRTSIEGELKFVIDSKSIDPIFPSVIKQRIIKEMTRLQQ